MEDQFNASDGNSYMITIDDEGDVINVTRGGALVGNIRLDYRDDEDDTGAPDRYHITHLALDACKGLGIGQRCLELHRECFGFPLTAGYAGIGQSSDGSHLTGDGPAFIAKMRKKGIVCP
ncbi:hypothetical protein AB1462_14385 [Pseudomonas sp. SB113]|uniref:hypothetical protein n=1 Tax=Pseudomonas sp. SB113 TaxID=3154123 RepID=UPI00345C722E